MKQLKLILIMLYQRWEDSIEVGDIVYNATFAAPQLDNVTELTVEGMITTFGRVKDAEYYEIIC